MNVSPRVERCLFQIIVCVAAIVPITAGGAGVLRGPTMLHGQIAQGPSLDSHFRYLSGLLFAIGVSFIISVLTIDRRAGLMRALGLIVVVGGLSRLLGAYLVGLPNPGQRFAFFMELLVVPVLLLWLTRIEKQTQANPSLKRGK